jgi:hypothetical protein
MAATLHAALTGAPWQPGESAAASRATPAGRAAPRARASGASPDRATRQSRDAVSFPGRTPAALADVIRAGLDPDPACRPTAAAFAGALEPLVAALPRRLTLGRRS